MKEIQLFKNDKDIQNFFTEKVVHWLVKHDYSKNHWRTVHGEITTTFPNASDAEIKVKFAASLEDFHVKYRNAVVKEDNLFHDMITACYSQIDWKRVSGEFISQL